MIYYIINKLLIINNQMTKFKIFKNITRGASKALSAPSRFISSRKSDKADKTLKLIKDVRAAKGAPNSVDGKVTDAFKLRTALQLEVNAMKRKAAK